MFHLYLLVFCLLVNLNDDTGKTVGRWKLERKIPLEGPNRCYVDELTFFDETSFELILNHHQRGRKTYTIRVRCTMRKKHLCVGKSTR